MICGLMSDVPTSKAEWISERIQDKEVAVEKELYISRRGRICFPHDFAKRTNMASHPPIHIKMLTYALHILNKSSALLELTSNISS